MRRILITILTAGWVVPFWLSGHTALSLLQTEIMPRLAGQNPINSFPHEHFISQNVYTHLLMVGRSYLLLGMASERIRDKEHGREVGLTLTPFLVTD